MLGVEQEKSDVAALEDKVRQGRITAPTDGTLYALPVKAGDYVKVGDLLAEMADLRQVRVRAFIDEPEMGALEPGQPVKITWDALPNRSWQGDDRGNSEAGGGAGIAERGRDAVFGEKRKSWNCCRTRM